MRVYQPGGFADLTSTVANLQREIKSVYFSPGNNIDVNAFSMRRP